MDKAGSEITLGGSEAALLAGALFALALWPFEQPEARAMLTDSLRERAQLMNKSISARWRARLREAGLWNSPTGLWTRELIEQRSMLPDGLVINDAERELAVVALTIIEREFSRDWGEFCLVIPGALDWYPLSPDDFGRLRRKIEKGADLLERPLVGT